MNLVDEADLLTLMEEEDAEVYTAEKEAVAQAEKEALDPDADYTEDKGDFEIPMEDEPEEPGKEGHGGRIILLAAFAALHIEIQIIQIGTI